MRPPRDEGQDEGQDAVGLSEGTGGMRHSGMGGMGHGGTGGTGCGGIWDR